MIRHLPALLALGLLLGLSSGTSYAQCYDNEEEYDRQQIGNTIHVWCMRKTDAPRVRAIDRQLASLERKIEQDRAALKQWQTQLPDYMSSLEEWVSTDEAAREATRDRARDLVLTLLTSRVVMAADSNISDTRAEIDTLWREFNNTPLGSPRFAEIVSEQAHGAGVIRKWQSYRDMAETVESLRDAYQGMDAAQKQQYGDAIIHFLKLTVHDPRLAVLVDDADFAATAVLGNITARVAESRIDQLLRLGDQRLKAVGAVSAVYRADIESRQKLLAEKRRLIH
jgi:hypothetical protein